MAASDLVMPSSSPVKQMTQEPALALLSIVSPPSTIVDLYDKIGNSVASTDLPPPPSPSADPRSSLPNEAALEKTEALSAERPGSPDIDIFNLASVSVLKLMCASIQDIVDLTEEIPPTPPRSHPMSPDLRAVSRDAGGWNPRPPTPTSAGKSVLETPTKFSDTDEIDGVLIRGTPIGSPKSASSATYNVIGANAEPTPVQHNAIVRKFYSKKPPAIALEEYVLRIHRYCPMSTAVYLATSLYIARLATDERTLLVTSRNVHRLLLAALRVAVKALEDRSFPHRRFAKVGGVSEAELKRLEISFCFVINFDLRVTEDMLLRAALGLRAAQKRRFEQGFILSFPPRGTRQL